MAGTALRRWLILGAAPVWLAAAAAAAEVPAAGTLPERPLFRLFGPAQGLPSSAVTKLALDRDNRLWLATLDGLARYDGVEFRVWRHDPTDPDSLPGNDVQFVLVDRADRVWLAVQDAGIARYDPNRDGFERWRHDPGDPGSLPGDRIWTLEDDGSGGVWAGGYRTGLLRLRADGRVQAWRPAASDPASLCDDIILSLLREPDDVLWIGTARGLCRYRPGHGFDRLPVAGSARRPGAPMISHIWREPDALWLSTNVGLRRVALDSADGAPGTDAAVADAAPVPVPAELAELRGRASLREPDGTLWYASVDGIRQWPRGRGEVLVHPARPGRALALPAPEFADVVRDREGNLWFASNGGGLAQLLPRWRAVRVYLPDPERDGGLPHGPVQFLGSDAAGRLLLVTAIGSGAVELDPVTGRSRPRFRDGDGLQQPDRMLLALLRDRAGRFWTGHRGRIARFDPGSGELHQVDADPGGRSLPGTMARRIAERADGMVMAAFGGGGLALVDGASMAMRFDPLGAESGLPCAEIGDIRFDADQAAWLACERGLLRVPAGSRRVEAVRGAPDGLVDGLAFAPDGQLWLHRLGTLEQYRVGSAGIQLQRSVGIDQGWPPFRAGGLVVDGDGLVWVAGPRGLFGFDPDLGQVRRYDQDDGLASAEFSIVPPLLLGANLLAAGTNAGPVLVDTRAVRAAQPAARLRWHEASVLRGGRRIALPPGPAPWLLRHDDRDLSLAVRLDSLSKPAGHRYRFRIDGHDSDWIEQVGQPERLIEHLASGPYRLQVKAFGADQQAALNELVQMVTVAPPPWQQPPALAGYALALLLALLALHAGQRRRARRRQALVLAEQQRSWAEQGSAAKTRFLAAVGHEIRTPMAGLLGMNALLLDSALDGRQRHYARCVSQAGEHMLALVNDLLDLSRIEAGKLELEPGPVDLPRLLDELLADVEAAAERKGLRLGLRIAAGTPLAVVADGKRLKQIVLNFLANAVKFTPAGRVRLLVSASDEGHLFAVQDDGPGLSDTLRRQLFERYCQDQTGGSNGGSGLGLAIARELAGLMGGSVGAENRAHGGSRFWLRVMLGNADGSVAAGPDLPLLLLVDPDPVRADDLVESLAALGARARHLDADASIGADRPDRAMAPPTVPCPVPALPAAAGAIALSTAATADGATAQLARHGLERMPRVLSLPLGADPPPAEPHLRVLSGPWQPAAVLAACRSLWHHQGTARPAPAPNDDLAGMRLLLVEDDPILREVLATRLTERGARVVAVDHGLAALARLGDDPAAFDAMLLDLDLPHLDGLRLLELLHARAGPPAPPAVVITARQQPDDLVRCRAAGAAGFFRKPVDTDALARRLLALRSLRSGRLARGPARASAPRR